MRCPENDVHIPLTVSVFESKSFLIHTSSPFDKTKLRTRFPALWHQILPTMLPFFITSNPMSLAVVYPSRQCGDGKLVQSLHGRHNVSQCFVVSGALIGYNIVEFEVFISVHSFVFAQPNVERYIGGAWARDWGWNKMIFCKIFKKLYEKYNFLCKVLFMFKIY